MNFLKLISLVFLLKTGLFSFAAEGGSLLEIKSNVQASEQKINGIKPGTEKLFQFANPKNPAPTSLAITYLHGFSATRQEVSPLVEDLAQKWGANLFFTRYKGHGIEGTEGLADASLEDWQRDTQEALAIGQDLGNKTLVMAMSTAAPLAIHEILKDQEKIAGLILISPNFSPARKDTELLLWPMGKWIARLVVGKYREWQPKNPEQAYFWTTRYPSSVLVEMMRAVDLGRKADLSQLQIPVLVLYCEQDSVVDPKAIQNNFTKIGSKRKSLLPVNCQEDNHILAGRILSPNNTAALEAQILKFLQKISH